MTNYTPGSTAGRWSAFIEPMVSRRAVFHLLWEEPHHVVDGKSIPRQSYEMHLAPSAALREGMFDDVPTKASSFEADDSVLDMLKAIVEEAGKMGIFASNAPGAQELEAVRDHLSDMRALALRDVPAVASSLQRTRR